MNILDILIGFVGGGAIGGGALYALQQGKISEALQKYEKIQAALGQTEAELKDTKGQLKLLDVSEERIRHLEATYREEVAKLQKELEDSQTRLQETAIASPSEDMEASYKAQMQELQEGYEGKIAELCQTYQGQIQEIVEAKQTEINDLRQSQQAQILEIENGYQSQIQQLEHGYQSQLLELQNAPQPVVAELPIQEDYQTTQIIEPWDEFPNTSEVIETPAEIFGREDMVIASEDMMIEAELSPEMDFLESIQPEMVDMTLNGWMPEPEFAPEVETVGDFGGIEESLAPEFAPEMGMFDGFEVEEENLKPEFMGEKGAFGSFETMVDAPPEEPEFDSEMGMFDGFETMEGNLESEPEFAIEMGLIAGLTEMEETFLSSEMTMIEDFPAAPAASMFESEEQAISNLEMSASDMAFLNSLQLEEETKTISSLGELSDNYDDIFSQETISNETAFFDLLPTEEEKFADAQNSLDDLFADTTNGSTSGLFEPFGEETTQPESKGKNGFHLVSDQEDIDFFSMLDNADTENLESLPSDEELPLDDLFSDDLFSDWDNGKTTKLESHQ
jgi:hypothetical protein